MMAIGPDWLSDIWEQDLTRDTPLRRVTYDYGQAWYPVLSPDGMSLAYGVQPLGRKDSVLRVRPVEGGNPGKVISPTVPGVGVNIGPWDWSPKRIGEILYRQDSPPDLFFLHLEG